MAKTSLQRKIDEYKHQIKLDTDQPLTTLQWQAVRVKMSNILKVLFTRVMRYPLPQLEWKSDEDTLYLLSTPFSFYFSNTVYWGTFRQNAMAKKREGLYKAKYRNKLVTTLTKKDQAEFDWLTAQAEIDKQDVRPGIMTCVETVYHGSLYEPPSTDIHEFGVFSPRHLVSAASHVCKRIFEEDLANAIEEIQGEDFQEDEK